MTLKQKPLKRDKEPTGQKNLKRRAEALRANLKRRKKFQTSKNLNPLSKGQNIAKEN